jgi:ribosome biogenesis GTPase
VLTGPSGVGKSSILNLLQPGTELRTAEISEFVLKGKHTTVSARLIPLGCGGYVVDTPGIREVGLWEINPDSLDICFPEFRPFVGDCRFTTCTHTHEPDCAIHDAASSGQISRARYESYLTLFAEANTQ